MCVDGLNIDRMHGLIVRTNPLLTEAGDPIEVTRSWKERLFTRPWKPLKKTKTIIPQVPSKSIIKLPDGSMVMHPETARIMKEMMDNINHEDLK